MHRHWLKHGFGLLMAAMIGGGSTAADAETVGGVLGWGAGYAIPVLLHYEWGKAAPEHAWAVSPWATSSTLGLAALGFW